MGWPTFLVIPLLGYALLLGFFYFFQERLVFFPHAGGPQTPADWGLAHQEFFLESGPGRIHGWWIPGTEQGPVVLYSHGNAATISALREYAQLFHQMGMGVLLYDYRGYGRSEGQPDEAGLYADGEAAWRHLTGELGVSPRRVVCYGHSLGGGVATWLAMHHPGLALVVEGSFTSIPQLGKELYPFVPNWVARISFDNLSRMARVQAPVLVIHAREDEVVPVSHGRRLHEAAREPKGLLEIAGSHNRGFVAAGREDWSAFQQFVTLALEGP